MKTNDMPETTTTPTPPPTPSSLSGSVPCSASLRVLKLTLKRRWFDMIAAGIKKEEYRHPSKWILSRISAKDYDVVEFRNGYSKDSPVVVVEYHGWHVSTGREEWGAEPRQPYLTLKLGKVLSLPNA